MSRNLKRKSPPAPTGSMAQAATTVEAKTDAFKKARFSYDRTRDFDVKEKRKKEEHEHEVKDAIKELKNPPPGQTSDSEELKQLFKKRKIEKDEKKKAAVRWGIRYTDKAFRDVGKISYAVPHFYIGNSALKNTEGTESLGPPQESDLRSDNAERFVFRAFRLLSNKLEEEGHDPMFIVSNVGYENVLIQVPDKERGYFDFKPKDYDRKESDVLILHEQKGIIFVQVKSYNGQYQDAEQEGPGKNTRQQPSGSKKKGPEEKARAQLENDEKMFKSIMDLSDGATQEVHKVWAWPALSRKDAEELCQPKKEKDIVMLSKDDLFEDSNDMAESEYSLKEFRAWWENLPRKPISKSLMKDIIARYIGPFSRPRDTNLTTERSHVRTVCDSVDLACKHAKTWCMNKEDDKKWKKLDKEKRVHLQGPPGSGRTMSLVQKAVRFLTEGSNRHVEVIDLCRGSVKYKGSLGRPVCSQIITAVKNDPDVEGKFEKNIQHCPLNLHDSKDWSSKLSALKGKKGPVLFIIDEILPQKEWAPILQYINDEFKDSHIWCADGIIPQTLDENFKFKTLKLSQIYRIPASVQRILRFADWVEERKESYIPDVAQQASAQILSTNGPTPVCIRHTDHDSSQPVIECDKCIQELAAVLKAMRMVAEGSDKAGGSQGGVHLPCSIAVLFGLPEDKYTRISSSGEEPKYIETSMRGVQQYEEKVEKLFVEKLKGHLQESVTLLSPLGNSKDLDAMWDDIVVSWTDFFMGLERDVVIYLPGDKAGKQDAAKSSRKIPMPGFKKEPTAEACCPRLAKLYWRKEDIDGYTDWDKANLMCAATRCCGQLILMTP